MPKCNICGRDPTIFAGDRWWCEHHYKLLKRKAEQIGRIHESEHEKNPVVDLGLAKI